MPLRRKKWTEEEERTLIDKYAEMLANGALARMKTREKKFRPIAAQVNLMHHSQDPMAFPWQWTWKDASTKVQNMRHQYLGVKQKIKKTVNGGECEEFDWVEGLTHWPNFLRYKDVFGDVALGFNDTIGRENGRNQNQSGGFDGRVGNLQIGGVLVSSETADLLQHGVRIDGGGNGVLGLGLGFEFEGEEGDEDNVKDDGEGFEYEEAEPVNSRKKRKRLMKGCDSGGGKCSAEQRVWAFLANQFAQLRERAARQEVREADRERARQRREQFRGELEEERERNLEEWEKEREEREQTREKLRQERAREWDALENESMEREKSKREEDLAKEREWEERMNRRRLEWMKRIDDMLRLHRDSMDQLHSRILQDQQNVINQLLGLLSQWTGPSTGLSDHTSTGNPYLSQMIQNLHHVSGIVPGENRVVGDNHDDQFIVDG